MVHRWPVERSWAIHNRKGAPELIRSSELLGYRACGLLGAAGMGKTCELSYLADSDRKRGLDVRFERLAVLGQTADSLESKLDVLAAAATQETVMYLDALDEVMVPVKTAGLIIERWVRDKLSSVKPALRISCRDDPVWPSRVEDAIREVYGEDDCAFALLQLLSPEDIKTVATTSGIDGDAFIEAVDRAGSVVLSQQPLTLEMLLRVYAETGSLPTRRKELFAQGMHLLAADRYERLEAGTAFDVPVSDVLDAAERLACLCLLSGRDSISLDDFPSSSALGRLEVETLPAARHPLDDRLLNAVGRSGLCDGAGPRGFRFAHRQFAESLAGRRLATLPLH